VVPGAIPVPVIPIPTVSPFVAVIEVHVVAPLVRVPFWVAVASPACTFCHITADGMNGTPGSVNPNVNLIAPSF